MTTTFNDPMDEFNKLIQPLYAAPTPQTPGECIACTAQGVTSPFNLNQPVAVHGTSALYLCPQGHTWTTTKGTNQ